MKVLLIVPKFFGYDDYIKRAIENNGHTVNLIYENIDDLNLYTRIICKIFKKNKRKICEKILERRIAKMDSGFEHLVVIRGAYITISMIDILKSKNHFNKTVLYQWDSISNNPNALVISTAFSNIYTFDKTDAKQLGWNYLPLFYIKRCDGASHSIYDYAFICTLHSKRLEIFNQLKTFCEKNNFKVYAYMYTNIFSYLKNIMFLKNKIFKDNIEFIHFHSISLEKVFEIYSQTRIIVDYAHPKQVGLTMRTIESLANGCKIITNNKSIKDEDFFREENIIVYENNIDNMDQDFYNIDYVEDQRFLINYCISNWVNNLL